MASAGSRVGAKPALLSVDDDPDVLRAVQRDLRSRYARDYRVLAAASGAEALDTVRELRRRDDPLALMLVDQRMPVMSGIDFLAEAIEIVPEAKRVLLTAYADTEAAIAAINRVGVDHYILKPWQPEEIYEVLDDLLDDWQAGYRPPYEGVTVVGLRWSADAHRVRDFLARNRVPYRWLELETNEEGQRLAGGASGAQTPLVVLPDGRSLVRPDSAELGGALALFEPVETPYFDLLIVGAGPAGLAAAVYGASEGLATALVEREAPGGQAGQSSWIENYLGFHKGISGAELSRRALTQALRFAVKVISPSEARSARVSGGYRIVRLLDGSELSCRALIIATGVSYQRLDVPGARRLEGLGVYYGASTTEAQACASKDVYIVGGGNSAGQATLYFAEHARAVHLVVRKSSLGASMSHYLVGQIEATPNVQVHTLSEIAEVHGEDHLERVTIRDNAADAYFNADAGGVFVFIGALPYTDWLDGFVARDARGFVPTGPDMKNAGDTWKLAREPFLLETSAPGVFAVGDVRANAIRRVASAVGEGSIAVQFVHRYLASE
jgi:thioredoxin reductase (NADPH)